MSLKPDRARDKQIARVIQSVNGVGDVTISGAAREIHIVVDLEKLNSTACRFSRSVTRRRRNVDPRGTVEQGKELLL